MLKRAWLKNGVVLKVVVSACQPPASLRIDECFEQSQFQKEITMRQFDNDADGGLGSESWATAFADAVTRNSVREDLVTLYADAFPPGYRHDFDAQAALGNAA